MASNHSASLGIPQPHFTSCITTHHHIPHAPHHHPTFHNTSSDTAHVASHHIAHILHCTLFFTSCSIAPYRTYSTLHLILHHSHIRMNKAQHPSSGIAKHSTSHQISHHTIPHRTTVMCALMVLKYVKCGMVCCAGNMV